MHKFLWDFEIQTDHLITACRIDLVIVNKKRTCQIVGCAVLADYRLKFKEREINKYTLLEILKIGYMKVTVIPSVIGTLGTISKGTGRLENKRASRDHPNDSIIKIGQNTKKSPGYPNSSENHELTLVWKTLKGVTIILTLRRRQLSIIPFKKNPEKFQFK